MGRVLGPGPGSMAGLKWLARVGPSPLDPWRYSMGWSEVAARSHAKRLETEGWLGRVPLLWGQGSMFYVTKLGVRVLGTGLGAPRHRNQTGGRTTAPVAWTAAWLTLRERRFLGEPEIRLSGEWSERLQWYEGYSWRKSGHRPDFIAWSPNDSVNAIEVELARKSRARLNAILSLHNNWMLHGKVAQLFYIVDDDAAAPENPARDATQSLPQRCEGADRTTRRHQAANRRRPSGRNEARRHRRRPTSPE